MDFREELSAFPSGVHRCIYAAARGITPLDRSLASVEDPGMRASCEEFHGFFMDFLSDMYDHPEAYGLPVMALENFCNGKTVNGMKQKFPSKTKSILSQTRNSVNGYMVLLYMMGRLGVLSGDILSLSPDDLKEADKRTNTSVSPIPLAVRLRALARVGLLQEGGGFVSKRHPGMFPAMCALAKKAKKQSGFDYFAFKNAEFRNIGANYKPTYEDYFHPLIESQLKQANTLHEYAIKMGLKPTVSTFWKVEYKYKGAQVMCIGTEGDHERKLDIRLVGTYNWDDPGLINDRLIKESPEFQKYAVRHVLRCDACSTAHLGRFVTVLGKRQRVCGGGLIGFRWNNPDDGDVEAIKQFIRLRMEIIEEINQKE